MAKGQVPSKQLGGWYEIEKEIDSGVEIIFDQIALGNFKSCKYIFSVFGNSKVKQFDFNVANLQTDIKDNLSSAVGSVNIKINTDIAGSNMVLKVKNDETFKVTAIAVRYKF